MKEGPGFIRGQVGLEGLRPLGRPPPLLAQKCRLAHTGLAPTWGLVFHLPTLYEGPRPPPSTHSPLNYFHFDSSPFLSSTSFLNIYISSPSPATVGHPLQSPLCSRCLYSGTTVAISIHQGWYPFISLYHKEKSTLKALERTKLLRAKNKSTTILSLAIVKECLINSVKGFSFVQDKLMQIKSIQITFFHK